MKHKRARVCVCGAGVARRCWAVCRPTSSKSWNSKSSAINLHKLSFHKQETKKEEEGKKKTFRSFIFEWFFVSLSLARVHALYAQNQVFWILVAARCSSLGNSTMTIVVVIVAVAALEKQQRATSNEQRQRRQRRRRRRRCQMAFVLAKVKNAGARMIFVWRM